MRIEFFAPLGRAWNRMKAALFQPFDLHKWFVVGFTAFLAGLADGYHGSSGSRWSHDGGFRRFLAFPGRAWDWLVGHPGWFMLIGFGVLVLVVFGVVVLWLSSRGKFMFLDNVVHDKAEVVRPWREYKREGDSLFLWRVIFALVCFVVFVSLVGIFFAGASRLYGESGFDRIPVPFILLIGLVFLFLLIVVGYISLFLDGFVVPVMYKHRISATRGWGRFLSILGKHPFHFLHFGVLMFCFMILFVFSVIAAGIVTCCIGWILLVIPYIGTVVTLPVWYWFRAFSIEFLAQFGAEYDVFPPSEPQPEKAIAAA